MDELKALISVVSQNKIKNIEVIGNGNTSKQSQVQLLYEGIARRQSF